MFEKELQAAIEAGLIAREIIMEIYNLPFDVEIKEDNSPVTLADKNADHAIISYLSSRFPTHYFLTEESTDNLERLDKEFVWIIDPVDGTKDFVNKDNEFTTCIALTKNGEVVVGVIIVPVTKNVYYAVKGEGSYELKSDGTVTKLHVSEKTQDITVCTSRYHKKQAEIDYLERNSDLFKNIVTLGSTLKAIAIAKGEVELFFRGSAGTKEWDVAASDLIVTEAGGFFIKPSGDKIKYNKKDVHNREGYIMLNKMENFRL